MAVKRKSILLTLIRCGQTTWESESRLHGASDLPLSAGGRAAVTEAGQALGARRLSTIYHTPDEAATETARLVAAATGAKTKPVGELSEADFGLLDGMTRQAFTERYPKRAKQWQEDPLALTPPEGEDLSDARTRQFAALSRLLRRCRGEEIGVVLRPLGLGFLRCWLADRPPSEAWAMVRDRPLVERYVVPLETVLWLAEAAGEQVPASG